MKERIQKWLTDPTNYIEGLDLLTMLQFSFSFILRLERPTPQNQSKLFYHIEKKYKEHYTAKKQTVTKEKQPILYYELPEVLRPKYRKQKEAFYKAAELKIKLNDLPTNKEKEAFALQWEIWQLRNTVRAVWAEIDLWKSTGRIIEEPKTKDNKIPTTIKELLATERRLRARISARKKTIVKTKEAPDSFKNNLKIITKERELTEIEIQLKIIVEKIKEHG